jgi:hypothetical protein
VHIVLPRLGGGIANYGPLNISNSTISGNRAQGGGGIFYQTDLLTVINNSTISGNSAAVDGGGIWNRIGTLAINNSTISGNSAGLGGGIFNGEGLSVSKLTISNATIKGNAASEGGGIYNYSGSTAAFQDSIVANSSSGGNCSGTISSHGYNLTSDDTCNFNNAGDLNNTDPKLGTLGSYGGPTRTIPLLSGSPAIDAGNPSGCTDDGGRLLKTDQRGEPRPDKDTGRCDMGAYELQND